MIDAMHQKLQQVCDAFCIQGTFCSYEEIKQGNVNRTFRVRFEQPDGSHKFYMVQKVNTYVFEHPIQVMDNIDRVTEYLRKQNPNRISLHFHHTRGRKTYVFDENGFWRLFNFIPSRTYDHCEDLEIVRNAGQAFGEFQRDLGAFNAAQLYATIPYFHDTRRRYNKLLDDVRVDPCGLVKEVREELDWLLSVQDKACSLTDLFHRGELPLRVTHNDTKINNVLFEKDGTAALAVIDLDTVMPGLVGHDFGDAIRFAANRVEEDCQDWAQAGMNMDVFREFADGFLTYTASTLTDREVNTLALSCFAMTCELATRFLDDYILGSPYFKTDYTTHNLVRARCQIALAKDMDWHLDEMQHLINKYVQKYR